MLYLIRGLPGSGKTTFALNYFKGIMHIENDMFHMITSAKDVNHCEYRFDNALSNERSMNCFYTAMKILEYNIPVVVSNVFPTIHSINRYVYGARELGQETKVFRMISKYENQHNVPKDVIKSMADIFTNYDGEYIVNFINGKYIIE